MHNRDEKKQGAVTAQRIEWAQAILGFMSGILLVAFVAYGISRVYSRFYGCDCGYDSPFSGGNVIQSNDLLWKDFDKCKIKLDQKLSYKISYTPDVKLMDGKKITLSGFLQPLEAKGVSQHFLLCKNAPSCAYCPPSKPNEIVELFTAKPVAWQQNLLTISGTLHLVNDGNKGIFFQIKGAV